jgi:hypothetical protein
LCGLESQGRFFTKSAKKREIPRAIDFHYLQAPWETQSRRVIKANPRLIQVIPLFFVFFSSLSFFSFFILTLLLLIRLHIFLSDETVEVLLARVFPRNAARQKSACDALALFGVEETGDMDEWKERDWIDLEKASNKVIRSKLEALFGTHRPLLRIEIIFHIEAIQHKSCSITLTHSVLHLLYILSRTFEFL